MSPDRALDAAVTWLAHHPRWTTAIIISSIWLAFFLERHLP